MKFLQAIEAITAETVRLTLAENDDSSDTVDGRNPAPADMVNIPLFSEFSTSQVVQDFFHPQYQWEFAGDPMKDFSLDPQVRPEALSLRYLQPCFTGIGGLMCGQLGGQVAWAQDFGQQSDH